jgi:predicted transcriptional regulator
MTVAEAAAKIQGTVVAGVSSAATREVRGGYASDLLSDTMGNSHEGDVWVTVQKHINIVAIAQLKNLAGIVVVNGRIPEADAIARADEEGIPIVTTGMPAFDVAGILYTSGVRGRRAI